MAPSVAVEWWCLCGCLVYVECCVILQFVTRGPLVPLVVCFCAASDFGRLSGLWLSVAGVSVRGVGALAFCVGFVGGVVSYWALCVCSHGCVLLCGFGGPSVSLVWWCWCPGCSLVSAVWLSPLP